MISWNFKKKGNVKKNPTNNLSKSTLEFNIFFGEQNHVFPIL